MIKSIADADFVFYNVIDSDTNEKLLHVRWADDETGEYDQFLTDKEGRFKLNENGTGVKFERRKGNIKLVKREVIK
jgi:hypothetical protein